MGELEERGDGLPWRMSVGEARDVEGTKLKLDNFQNLKVGGSLRTFRGPSLMHHVTLTISECQANGTSSLFSLLEDQTTCPIKTRVVSACQRLSPMGSSFSSSDNHSQTFSL